MVSRTLSVILMVMYFLSWRALPGQPRLESTDQQHSILNSSGVIVNMRPTFTDVNHLEPWIPGISYLRVWGGSRGMATYPSLDSVPRIIRNNPRRFSVVTEEEVQDLLSLQIAHGVRIIYMVNINDSLESQYRFIQHLLEVGLDIAILELGNEIYLRKYLFGDLEALGVTRSWSPQEYVEEVLDHWAPRLHSFQIPMYLVGASHGIEQTPGNDIRREWNRVLLEGLERGSQFISGVTFHRYAGEQRTGNTHEEEISNQSFEFLTTFGSLPIAITESGYFFTEMNPTNLEKAAEFWSAFRAALKPEDLFGIHLLQRRPGAQGDLSYGLYDHRGITPVGERFDSWLRNGR
jgi:hypothetical protein